MCRAIVLLLIASFNILQAELVWEKTFITLKARSDDTVLEAVYKFTNKSDLPVKIEKVKSSCGCTTATTDKETYAPGERGLLKAVFTVGDRVR